MSSLDQRNHETRLCRPGIKQDTDPKGGACGETTNEASNKQSDALCIALMAQQLPLHSGNELLSGETFEKWITCFELVAEVHMWSSQAQLIHLITRLRSKVASYPSSY